MISGLSAIFKLSKQAYEEAFLQLRETKQPDYNQLHERPLLCCLNDCDWLT